MSVRGAGLRDWYLQRVTTVFMSAYVLPVAFVALLYTDFTLDNWRDLHSIWWMRLLAGAAWTAYSVHAYIGLWVVCTDYIHHCALRCAAIITLRLSLALTWLFVLYMLIVWS